MLTPPGEPIRALLKSLPEPLLPGAIDVLVVGAAVPEVGGLVETVKVTLPDDGSGEMSVPKRQKVPGAAVAFSM